jgi:hypothetical protein
MQYKCLSEMRMEAALLVETRFVSQQVVYHGTGDENITSHCNRQSAGEVWLGKINRMSTASGDNGHTMSSLAWLKYLTWNLILQLNLRFLASDASHVLCTAAIASPVNYLVHQQLADTDGRDNHPGQQTREHPEAKLAHRTSLSGRSPTMITGNTRDLFERA